VYEQLKHYYGREEEFLDHFETVAIVAARSLQGAWTPDYRCNDTVRGQRDRMLADGTLRELVFSGAALYHVADHCSSVQIALRSASRTVNVRVTRTPTQELMAATLLDRQTP
jgi:hypothetical protein